MLFLLACTTFYSASHADVRPTDPPEAPVPPAPPPPPPTLELLAVGDIIPHGSVKSSVAHHPEAGNEGWDSLFSEVRERISAADLAFINLETPIAPDRNGPTGQKVFNGPVALLNALVDAGFDAVSLANNHVWDQSRSGLVETVGHLEKTPLAWAGAGRTCEEAVRPWIFEKNGYKIGWISSSRIHNLYLNEGPQDPCVFKFSVTEILASAKKAREQGAELVFLSLHWGVEYESTPKDWDRHYAHDLLNGGIDGIFGHHPHVLQPLETYETTDGRHTFVDFSLGNFISGQAFEYRPNSGSEWGLRRDGGLLSVKIERVDGKAGITQVHLEPLWTEHGETCLTDQWLHSILLEPSLEKVKETPELSACATHYAQRIAAVRRVVGASFVP
jgi:poly-gamma-glutamate synthesis protein (capsule biosynthesis protein)